MHTPVLNQNASQLRRFLFAGAGFAGIASLAFLASCLLRDRLAAGLSSSFDFVGWFVVILFHMAGCYLCADMAVELYRGHRASCSTWADGQHFEVVARVCIFTLIALVLFYWIAYEGMLEPERGSL